MTLEVKTKRNVKFECDSWPSGDRKFTTNWICSGSTAGGGTVYTGWTNVKQSEV